MAMNEASIFAAALERPTGEGRAAYLAEACGGDEDLRRRVEALIRAHAGPDEILDAVGSQAATAAYAAIAEQVGSQIGPYKLLQKLGEGGFGVVFMAEQEKPVRRMVALKIVKPGMDTNQVIARFESERQALALMDHPNIARVFDAGATQTGRPYFVMELVKGVPITEFCDKNRLPPAERLKLFIDVCHAIQHAHHKGVIHRDVKPSNVMVTLHDGVPVVKAIDFGVAKATVQKLTERTLFTAYGQMIGTPAYMSPEQAEMSGLDIDTRSDVYSLGVLLYELLTGTTPLESQRLREAGYIEMQRLIREVEPPKPSTRLSSLGESAITMAGNRGLDAKRLRQLLAGDLDWIVMKALDKDRNRRYETPGNFAEDIERYLRREAIRARPPSTAYKLKKTAQRNRVAVITVAMVALSLFAGTVVATWQAVRARRAEQEAQRQRAVAQLSADEAQSVNRFLTDDLLGQADPDLNHRDKQVTVEEVLAKAAANIDGNPKFVDKPTLEATLQLAIGKTFFKLSNMPEAERHLRRAMDLRQKHLGRDEPSTLEAQETLADFLNRGAYRPVEAEAIARETWEARVRVLGAEHRDSLNSLDTYAQSLLDLGHPREGIVHLRQCLDARRRTLGPNNFETLLSMNNLASALVEVGEYGEATLLLRESVAYHEREKNEGDYAICLSNLVNALSFDGQLSEADRLLQAGIKREEARGGQESDQLDRLRLIQARTWIDLGQLEDGVRLAEEVVAQRRARDPRGRRLGVALSDLGRGYALVGRWRDAEESLAASLAIFKLDKPPMFFGPWAELWYGQSLAGQQRYTEAEPRLLAAEAGLHPNAPTPKHYYRRALELLVQFYETTGKPDQAAEWQTKLERFAAPSK
jgi:serine/threonine protein kinase